MAELKNGFTEGQEALIEKIAFRVGEQLLDRMESNMAKAFALHSADCPTGKRVQRAIWVGMGIGLGLSLLGITTIPALWNFFTKGHS